MDLLNPASDSESEDNTTANEPLEDGVQPKTDLRTLDPREVEVMPVDDQVETAFGDQMVVDPVDGGDKKAASGSVMDVDGVSGHRASPTAAVEELEFGHLRGSLKQNPGPMKQASLASFFRLPSASTSKKRRASLSSEIDHATTKDLHDDRKWPRPEGKSKSAIASRALREKYRKGELEVDETQLKRWKKKIIGEDSKAEFNGKNTFAVRHSKCGDYINAKEPFDVTRFRQHIKQCTKESQKRRPASGVPSLLGMGWSKIKPPDVKAAKIPVSTSDKPMEETYPCPGLTELNDAQIPVYLRRTGFVGGGARSLAAIAMEKFEKLFSLLGSKNKKEVVDIQLHEHQWRNKHDKCRVFATKCKHVVAEPTPNERPLPCEVCQDLLHNK
jgi:hypothetical protein